MEFSVFSDEHYMKLAYQQALKAKDSGEIPVGAVIVCGNTVVAKAYNQTEMLQDVTAHAEILAITSAANYLGAKYLTECTLYVTLEPCTMCAGAIHWSQLKRLVYGAADPLKGYSLFSKSNRTEHTGDSESKSNRAEHTGDSESKSNRTEHTDDCNSVKQTGDSRSNSGEPAHPPEPGSVQAGGHTTGGHGLLHPRTEVLSGLMAEPCGRLVEDFFRELRN